MTKVLLIETDEANANAMQGGLELLNDYEVEIAHNGREGLEKFGQFVPDVLITDSSLSVMDGYELVKLIRSIDDSIVIIMQSGSCSPEDVIKGLQMGADNYLTKSYVAEELAAYISAIKKRINKQDHEIKISSNDYIYIGKYKLDILKETLELDLHKQKLTKREAAILKILYVNINTIVPRDKLLTDFWGEINYYHSRSLDVFISKLRRYLSQDPSIHITTIKRQGLILTIQE